MPLTPSSWTHCPNASVVELVEALKKFLKTSPMMAYLAMMAPRLVELHRVLKPTGSLYLHCDPTASHYLKLVLDAIFGGENFLNEIIWKRTNARSTEGKWPRVHDVILMYSKSDTFLFESLQVPADKAKMPHTLITAQDGKKYQTYELTAPGMTKEGVSGKPWRGFDPSQMGRHWANNPSTMDEWDAGGLIHWPKDGGFPRRRGAEPFVDEARLVTVSDVWTDIDRINQTAKERLGYPTQKPLALMERIIEASCPKDGVVLDPFCGCGTTVHAAQKLGRQWIGIDITYLAINLIKRRLRDAFGDDVQFEEMGNPTDFSGAERLAEQDKFQFQHWALSLVGARPLREGDGKGADRGVDGLLYFYEGKDDRAKLLVQVKGGGVNRGDIATLLGDVKNQKAMGGVLITLEPPTKPMVKEAVGRRPLQVEALREGIPQDSDSHRRRPAQRHRASRSPAASQPLRQGRAGSESGEAGGDAVTVPTCSATGQEDGSALEPRMRVIPHGLKYAGFFDDLNTGVLKGELMAFADGIRDSFSISGGSRVRYFCRLTTKEEGVEPEGHYEDALRSFLPELESRQWLNAKVRIEHGIQLESGQELSRPRSDEFFELSLDRAEGTCEIQCRLRERRLTEELIARLIERLSLSAKPKKHSRDVPEWLERKLLCDSIHLCNVCRQDDVIIHHIVAVEDGGRTAEDNLIVLCLKHHGKCHSSAQFTRNIKPEDLREYKRRHLAWVAQQGRTAPLGRITELDND